MAKFLKLVEDAVSDKKQRNVARKVVKSLQDYIEKNGEDAFRELSPNRKYIVVGSDFIGKRKPDFFPPTLHPSDIRFYFKKGKRGANPYYDRDELVGGTKHSITLPFLDSDGSLDRVLDKIKVKQDVLMHEFTHLLDDVRTGLANDLIDLRQAGGEYADAGEGYYNEPFELNAYFQGAIGDFEDFMERSPETLAALSDQMKDFRSFKEFMFDQQFDDGFIENLTGENKERVIKRLYQFYEDFRKTDLFQKHVSP